MSMISNGKIESNALNALESIIDDHPTMDYSFNKEDKEMSWDGFIRIYKNPFGVQSKANFDSRVFVQIKGHYDCERKYILKKRIKYPVEINDLKAFATEKGVLYFQIFINGKEREIFYSSLYPSKILDFIETAEKNKNKKCIGIPFNKLQKDADVLYSIVKQFDIESKQQGTAYSPLVMNRIKSGDINTIKSLNATIVGENDIINALPRLESGDICFYGQVEDDPYLRPIEWVEGSKFYVRGDVNNQIKIGKKVWYNRFQCMFGSDETISIRISANLSCSYKKDNNKIGYKLLIKSSLEELYKDAQFLLSLEKANAITIGNATLNGINFNMPEGMHDFLCFIIDLHNIFIQLHLSTEIEMTSIDNNQFNHLKKLVELSKGKYNNRFDDGLIRYLFSINDKIIPIIINKKGKSISVVNAIYDENYHILYSIENGNETVYYRMPLFVPFNSDELAKLYKYDYERLIKQINSAEVNKDTAETLVYCVLNLICAYDINFEKDLLQLANALLHRLEPFVEKKNFFINCYQIEYRLGILTEEKLQAIKKIKSNNPEILFGKNVLLHNKKSAIKYYEQMSFEMQLNYKRFPIYNLFKKMLD